MANVMSKIPARTFGGAEVNVPKPSMRSFRACAIKAIQAHQRTTAFQMKRGGSVGATASRHRHRPKKARKWRSMDHKIHPIPQNDED